MKQNPCKKSNLLIQAYPELAKQWHPMKNQGYPLHQITKGMALKVWWQCELGHEWRASVNQRTQGTNCPYCSGRLIWIGFNDLATTHPELVKQWHPTKNGALTPQQVSKGSSQKVWWQCPLGHEWKAPIKQRAGWEPTSCPTCLGRRNLRIQVGFNDLATTHPELVKQWHPTKNGALTPQQVSFGMGRKVWWRCGCGCEWEARILSRHQGRGCPDCAKEGRKTRQKKKTGKSIRSFA